MSDREVSIDFVTANGIHLVIGSHPEGNEASVHVTNTADGVAVSITLAGDDVVKLRAALEDAGLDAGLDV